MSKCTLCDNEAHQILTMKTVLINADDCPKIFKAGDVWNSTGEVIICSECSIELFKPFMHEDTDNE